MTSTQDRIYPEDVTLICPNKEQVKRVIERSSLRIWNAEFVRAAKKGSSRYLAGFLKDAVDKGDVLRWVDRETVERAFDSTQPQKTATASRPTPQTHSHERWPLDGEIEGDGSPAGQPQFSTERSECSTERPECSTEGPGYATAGSKCKTGGSSCKVEGDGSPDEQHQRLA
ncbi:hypothetical protein PENPOL_c004G00952 [Penicillium polonicum]|uniref:Uncharacterized protein n=1 Tax=Penicillium polonicum TaxID=60169 RepID=A0A1V6NPG7_PENPO|nr:hypothetical protein PENPOL_c004G00952 [Penicillium polonicum]